MPATEPHLAAVDEQLRLVAAQCAQLERVGGGRLRAEQRQVGLRRTGDRLHEPQAVRMREPVPAGDVHRPEYPPGARVVHRRRRTGPGLHPAAEVLGREHLHRPVHGDRRTRRVRSDGGLRPPCARHEVHPSRLPLGRRMSLDPQQPAVRVAHGEQMLAVGGERTQQLPEQRHHPRQRMLGAVGAEIAVRELHARRPVRADPGPRGTPPRVGHHRTHRLRYGPHRGERLMRTTQHPHTLGRVGPRLQGHPWIAQLGLPGRRCGWGHRHSVCPRGQPLRPGSPERWPRRRGDLNHANPRPPLTMRILSRR